MKNLFYILLLSPLLFISSCEDDFEIIGCTDATACNYDELHNQEDGSCEYPEQGYDCNGNWNLKVGDLYGGGIVFYIDETGFNGLISSIEDAGKFEWGCMTELGMFNTQIGSGYQNSWDIVNNCFEDSTAASVALAYVSGGYTDWFLPSKDELVEMYNTIGNGGPQGNIGGFEEDEGFDVGGDWNTNYWSSSEYSNTGAWGVDFLSGNTYNGNSKESPWRVRPIRCFGAFCSY
tara:strand:- start:120 stop:818 length:699 start_codon:yes stop_codon:yes gene_type:complete